MLHEFLIQNRNELISRCRAKASKRDSPAVTALELQHGIPLFLEQLVEALRYEQTKPLSERNGTFRPSIHASAAAENSRTAALHGKELLRRGYTVDQLVHGYGDVCQAITELAGEENALITVREFNTFNRLLDSAIADAVSAYGQHRDAPNEFRGSQELHDQMGTLADELRDRVNIALKAFDALRVGNIGVGGTTGSLLERSLLELRELIDKSIPEIRLSTGMTSTPKPPAP